MATILPMLAGMFRRHRKLWGNLALIALLLSGANSASAQGRIPEPGVSTYTLEIQPFAQHTGDNAIDLTHPPDDSGRVFVSTQSGQVFGFAGDGRPLGVFLDLTKARADFTRTKGSYNGLMYIAFHPDYARPGEPGFGKFYTGHQVAVTDEPADYDSKDFGAMGDSDVRFVIAQWAVDPENPDRIDPASYRRLLLLNFHTYASNPHAVGKLAFNPYAQPGDADYGKLYAAIGDSHNGDYGKPTNLVRAQHPDNPFAKLLRIDPLPADGKAYTIPNDNPFGTEVYALGLRGAQTFSFALDLDRKPVIVSFDIGALQAEEINIIRPGGNYGWDRYEGTLDFNPERITTGPARPPVVQYGRRFPTRVGDEPSTGSAAIIGGLVVSDPQAPSFKGQVLFGDLTRGTLMHANYHHALTVEQTGRQSKPYVMNVRLGDKVGNFADVIGTKRGDTRFGTDQSGAVYIVSKQTGTIFKTRLLHTAMPVESEAQITRGMKGTNWALLAIIAITVLLAVELAWVWRKGRAGRAG